jgi:hypothetical protein
MRSPRPGAPNGRGPGLTAPRAPPTRPSPAGAPSPADMTVAPTPPAWKSALTAGVAVLGALLTLVLPRACGPRQGRDLRQRREFGSTVVYFDSTTGNQDPYVWNEAFLHSYCHITRFHAEAGDINLWVSGDRFPQFSRLYCDLVFTVARKCLWTDANDLHRDDPLVDSDEAWAATECCIGCNSAPFDPRQGRVTDPVAADLLSADPGQLPADPGPQVVIPPGGDQPPVRVPQQLPVRRACRSRPCSTRRPIKVGETGCQRTVSPFSRSRIRHWSRSRSSGRSASAPPRRQASLYATAGSACPAPGHRPWSQPPR